MTETPVDETLPVDVANTEVTVIDSTEVERAS